MTPHVAQNTGRMIDGRTTRHATYAVSQRKRKCIEQCFGWGKAIGPMWQVMVRGLAKVDQLLTPTMGGLRPHPAALSGRSPSAVRVRAQKMLEERTVDAPSTPFRASKTPQKTFDPPPVVAMTRLIIVPMKERGPMSGTSTVC